jgi:hypothetical protein
VRCTKGSQNPFNPMPFHSCSLLKSAALWSACAAAWIAACVPAFAHGFAGDRFFPATISTADPFAASEMSLPTFSEIRQPGQPPVKVFDISTDLSLLVLPRTALTIVTDNELFLRPAQRQAGDDLCSAGSR